MDEHEALKHRYNELVKDSQRQHEAYVKMANQISVLTSKLIEAQQDVTIKQAIMANALTEQNAMKENYANEIRELKAKINE